MNHHHHRARKAKFKKQKSLERGADDKDTGNLHRQGSALSAKDRYNSEGAETFKADESSLTSAQIQSRLIASICHDADVYGEDVVHDNIGFYLSSTALAKVDAEGEDGLTLLMALADKGYHRLFNQLADKFGARMDHCNARGYTVLMAACEGGNDLLIVKQILNRHCDDAYLNRRNESGYSALMLAAFSEGPMAEDVCEHLLHYEVHMHYLDLDEFNALTLAVLKNKLRTVNSLFAAIEYLKEDHYKGAERQEVRAFKATYKRSLDVLRRFAGMNPEFTANYLMCEEMDLVRLEDADVDFNHVYPIRKGDSILAGSNKRYDPDGHYWDGYFGLKTSLGSWRSIWECIVKLQFFGHVKQTDAGVFTTPIPRLSSIEAVDMYAELAATLERYDFLDAPAVQAAVDFAWQVPIQCSKT